MSDNKRNKMSPSRRIAARNSLGNVCMTCGLAVCWSRETPDKAPWKATLGHVVGEEIGGTSRPGNLGSQCWACNWSAKCSGRKDLTGDVIPGTVPTAWLPTKAALLMPDVRDCKPAQNLPDKAARVAARKARGLSW
jgi:hypothetical protein